LGRGGGDTNRILLPREPAPGAVHRRYRPLRPYEVMVILSTDLEEETLRPTVERWMQLLESKGAERGHIDIWGKRRFAYEIGHRWEGYYVVFQARSEPAAMDELGRMLSLADDVIRHKVLRVPEAVYGPPKTAGTPADA
jgi:small subunit ribosomal protein S6